MQNRRFQAARVRRQHIRQNETGLMRARQVNNRPLVADILQPPILARVQRGSRRSFTVKGTLKHGVMTIVIVTRISTGEIWV